MLAMFLSLFSWMPPILQVICIGAIAIFFIIILLRLIIFILELIPWL